MGRTKEHLIELEEQAEERRLARLLGVTYEEFSKLKWRMNTNEGSDGYIYSYFIEFDDSSPQEILGQIKRLDGKFVYFEPWELDGEYDFINDQFDAITESRINHQTFEQQLDNLMKLSHLQTEGDELKTILNRQIFVSIISTLESFLSDTFLKLVFDNKDCFKNFVQTHPEFKSQKFELREIFQKQSELEAIVKRIILDTTYHNLPTVRNMYQDTFEIKFPSINKMHKYVLIRHDLVHRNGKTKEGSCLHISDKILDELIFDCKELIFQLCVKLKIFDDPNN
jgi:hypothetical protein